MKNYLAISAICLFGLSLTFSVKAHDKKYKELLKAVELSSSEASIKRLLKRATLTEVQKNALLDAADAAIEESEQSVSLLKSSWDFAKCTTSAVLSGLGLGMIGAYFFAMRNDIENETVFRIIGGAGTVAAILGAYGAVKGYACPTALNRYKHAETIGVLLKEAFAADKAS